MKKKNKPEPTPTSNFMKDLRKITKSTTFEDSKYSKIEKYISTGDFGLNRILSGSIYNGIPEGKVIILGGESQCIPRSQKVTILKKRF